MRVYLAGPMRGYPHLNFPAFFEAEKTLTAMGYTVHNPAAKGAEKEIIADPILNESLKFRRRVFKLDLDFICEHAEAVVLLSGWENSRGAVAEQATAHALGIPVMLYEDMKKNV